MLDVTTVKESHIKSHGKLEPVLFLSYKNVWPGLFFTVVKQLLDNEVDICRVHRYPSFEKAIRLRRRTSWPCRATFSTGRRPSWRPSPSTAPSTLSQTTTSGVVRSGGGRGSHAGTSPAQTTTTREADASQHGQGSGLLPQHGPELKTGTAVKCYNLLKLSTFRQTMTEVSNDILLRRILIFCNTDIWETAASIYLHF
jgi:hypothetical protein